MRAEINHDKKLILVWQATDEVGQSIPKELECEIAPLRHQKYKLIILKSGSEDLFETALYLLKSNRMKAAQQEVKAERSAIDSTSA